MAQRVSTELMTVRVPDRSGWGTPGAPLIVVRCLRISRSCPVCAGPRGNAYPFTFFDDGDWYHVDRWDNPCGHLDLYSNVLTEVAAAAASA